MLVQWELLTYPFLGKPVSLAKYTASIASILQSVINVQLSTTISTPQF
jgi:hypothetical protein